MKKIGENRVAIFIDGGNFYRKIRDDNLIPKGIRFDYVKFAEFLARGRTISLKTYYIGIVKNHDNSLKSQKLVESQQKLLSALENNGYKIKRGKIVYDNKIREKGVDVQIGIDLVIGAVENHYDTAIIVSSDTDLIPAIRYIKSKGKKVEYVGFSNAPSIGMIKESNARILMLKEQLEDLQYKNIKDRNELKIVMENKKESYKSFEIEDDLIWKDYPLKGVTYPTDYGYVEGYKSEDGHDLDVFIGTGYLNGYIKVWRCDVPLETKFILGVTVEEYDKIIETFLPVIKEQSRFSNDLECLDKLNLYKR